MSRSFRLSLAAALITLTASCATTGSAPTTRPMSAARAALPPEYRLFYDALEEDGDWTLIEPYGYVFRPDVNFVAWHPYERGFWVPSDVYGWVWISTEPFGWATFHYGRWMYDDYQGWVWMPGLDWGPAWVSWEMGAEYVGWAPLPPDNYSPGSIPAEATRWAPIDALAATDLSARIVSTAQLGAKAASARPVRNIVERGGVRFNAGPPLDVVERVTGPLPRVRFAEMDPPARGDRGAAADATARIEATRRAGGEAAREAALLSRTGGPIPSRVPLVRPELPARRAPETRPGAGRGAAAPADTSRR